MAPFLDFGTVGGLIYFAVVGVIAGLLYRGFRTGEAFGLLLYPLLFVGLIELPRYLQWAEGRFFPSWLALVAVAIALKWRTRHEPVTPPKVPPREPALSSASSGRSA